jgi:hypothetical protein
MSVSIHTLLADELDIPDQKAEKLLVAMLREVRKRARRGGVRLPDLGKFKVEDGELTFFPADSLARAVNHRFEGLEPEHLRNAPEPETGEDEDTEGPSTITLGYQDSGGWTPLDADEPPAETEDNETETGTDDETEADTEELYPLVDEVTGESAPDDPSSAPDASSTADAPSPESASQPQDDEERDELSRIWTSGPDKDTPNFSMDTEVDDHGDEADEDDLSLDDIPSETETDASTADPDEGTVSDEGPEKELEPSSSESSPTPSESSSEGGSPFPACWSLCWSSCFSGEGPGTFSASAAWCRLRDRRCLSSRARPPPIRRPPRPSSRPPVRPARRRRELPSRTPLPRPR